MHGIVWSYNVSNGPKFTYTGKNDQNLDGPSEKSDCLRQHCDPQESLLEPWKGDCHQVQHAAAETIWKEDCLISSTLFLISSWIDKKIQGEHYCNFKILLGTKLQVNRKSFTFPFLNIWIIGQKVGNCYYSTTRSSSKIFRVGYE